MIPEGLRSRIEGFSLIARDKGFRDPEGNWLVDCAYVNASQTARYSGSVHSVMLPTLLRGSHLIDLASQRWLLAVEHFLVHGFPLPGCEDVTDAMASCFPCPRLLPPTGGALSPQSMRSLMGDSMHWSQVSIWFLFMLATSRPTG